MNTKEKLYSILSRLIKCIEGDYFIGDGALLGIHREEDLISYDNDIDIYLLQGTKINYKQLQEENLLSEDYYLNEKIYDPSYEYIKKNSWLECLRALRVLEPNKNRPDLISLATCFYNDAKIQNKHTEPNIDIFYIKHNNTIENWENMIYFNDNELSNLETFNLKGIDVKIPNKDARENILKRQYGLDFMIPDPHFRYL